METKINEKAEDVSLLCSKNVVFSVHNVCVCLLMAHRDTHTFFATPKSRVLGYY